MARRFVPENLARELGRVLSLPAGPVRIAAPVVRVPVPTVKLPPPPPPE